MWFMMRSAEKKALMTIGKEARHEAAVVMTVIFYAVICGSYDCA